MAEWTNAAALKAAGRKARGFESLPFRQAPSRRRSATAQCSGLDTKGMGHGRPVAAVLVKMIDEYALHAGQAHMLRFAALGELER